MMPEKEDQLREELARQPYPILFATVSGAHLYGFPSPDSDVDLRGVHLLPLRDVVGLGAGREMIEGHRVYDGREVDLVTYDLKRFCELLLKKNGAPLEQVYSPLVVATSPMHDADLPFYQAEYERLSAALKEAHQASTLPEGPSPQTKRALNDLLVRTRLQYGA